MDDQNQTVETTDGFDADVRPGPPLSPSEIRDAEVLERFCRPVWLWSDGEQTELRRVPPSCERIAIRRSRELR